VNGLCGLDKSAEDLAGGQHAAEEEQGGQDQEVGAAVQGQELSCLTSETFIYISGLHYISFHIRVS
jgi:hypothetical protein